ncbi:membrane-spanning 4-domains subfamily A member 18 [Amia ocellicauda]|uniref:membrane-spanning 4-domains subfamily A member 18 n=1 Tax=Amia ocellicauda TaxID=2972642 RepID=UPI003464A173
MELTETTAEGPGEPQATVVGGHKPLHRFLKGEPTSVGIAVLFLGCGQFIFGIAMKNYDMYVTTFTYIPFWIGLMYIASGLLCIFCEKKPSKTMVTVCLSFCIISVVGGIISLFIYVSSMGMIYYHHINDFDHEDPWIILHYRPLYFMKSVMLAHSVVGVILLMVMCGFAAAALRSSRTQAVIIMRNLPSE